MSDTQLILFNAALAIVLALIAAGALTLRQTKQQATADTGKSNADAAGAITDAATALVEPLAKRVTELTNEVSELSTQVTGLRMELRLRDELATSHFHWDLAAAERLRQAGVLDFPAAPPLRP